MTVKNMTSHNGNSVPNQFIIRDGNGNTVFQSYNSTIIKIDNDGNTFLDERYWDYSVTTGKYRNLFLRETKEETMKKINSGKYKLVNLNK